MLASRFQPFELAEEPINRSGIAAALDQGVEGVSVLVDFG
jgi:hypothetical protein